MTLFFHSFILPSQHLLEFSTLPFCGEHDIESLSLSHPQGTVEEDIQTWVQTLTVSLTSCISSQSQIVLENGEFLFMELLWE